MGGIRRCESIEELNPHNITDPTWEYEGIKGDGEKPSIVGTKKGHCVIVAGAKGVYEEFEKSKELTDKFDLYAVNEIGQYIHHYLNGIITAHPGWAAGWIEWRARPQRYSWNRPFIISDQNHWITDILFSGLGNQVGTSGMLACLICICLGYDKIILCGMPLDFSIPHFYNVYSQNLDDIFLAIIDASWNYAINKLPTFKEKIRSMSGRTREWLGEPTKEWLCA